MRYKHNSGIQPTRFERNLVIFSAVVIIAQLTAFALVMEKTPIGNAIIQFVVAGTEKL